MPCISGRIWYGVFKTQGTALRCKIKGFQPKFIIETCKDPSKECFEGGDFNKDLNDDWFILSALKSGYDIQNIVVISSDNNSLLSTKNRKQFFEIIELQFVTRDFLAQRFEIITLQP